MSIQNDVRQILAGNRKTEDKITALVEYIEGFETVYNVFLRNTHAAVETVEIYGLEIGVDANGHAAAVSFPDGALVDE